MKILCIGDTMLDVVAKLESEIHYASDTRATISTHGGGAAANVASWLATTGINTHLIVRVGEDAAGKTVLSELDRYGVGHSNTVLPGETTGVVIVLVDLTGERTMFPDWGANSGLGTEGPTGSGGHHRHLLVRLPTHQPKIATRSFANN